MFTCGLLRSNFSLAICFSAPQSNSFKTLYKNPLLGRFARGLLDDFLRNRSRRLGVMRKMHGERGASLCATAQIRGVPEHLRQWDLHANDVAARAVFRSLNFGAARIQVSEDGRHIFFR